MADQRSLPSSGHRRAGRRAGAGDPERRAGRIRRSAITATLIRQGNALAGRARGGGGRSRRQASLAKALAGATCYF